ncbi:hypothetical protein MPTK1_3g03020 [Marchantia polymorpha subsp. ruderalis]|uniref:Uncharacterized protein n=2 Tax=Marchantia polymorpha TaxID=3197 RepID=A0AAF6AWW6_MARPO|nr:hypothetical protein MARPO_0007s0286 [Marchantia polymorpha]BBN04250.1 hypothetical protein Mp_3g03020 [Marchantia polymorpha subsp. ruderalis]|eukprot:PTQ47934.1 hypothetical protein MARPO_0007s0286 [Marchantia polymorpha]
MAASISSRICPRIADPRAPNEFRTSARGIWNLVGNERSGEAEATGVASRAGGGCGMKLQSRCGARSRTKREPDSLSDSKRTSEGRASPMMVARGGSVGRPAGPPLPERIDRGSMARSPWHLVFWGLVGSWPTSVSARGRGESTLLTEQQQQRRHQQQQREHRHQQQQQQQQCSTALQS